MIHWHDTDIAAYRCGSQALLALIRDRHSASDSPAATRLRAEARLARTRQLLAALGNPHQNYPIVHVTGTSGKGSTCAAMAAMLTAAGYRVGLYTSPYLQVATEKLQIGESLIDARSFERLVQQVLAEGTRLDAQTAQGSRFGYAEAWSALAFSWFAEREVDVAIVEVGAGGRYDPTNVVDSLVSVITSVGLDHLDALGPTLARIAWHKAGIIKPGAVTVIGEIPDDALPVIIEAAQLTGARLVWPADTGPGQLKALTAIGRFQLANARMAVTAIEALRNQGYPVPEQAIAAGLGAARLPGRLEAMPMAATPHVWIDGAHNPDKIAAVAREAGRLGANGIPPVLILGLLGGKDAATIIARLCPVASAIVATSPTVLGKPSLPAASLARAIHAAGFRGEVIVEPTPTFAIARALEIADRAGTNVLVTGSLYLAGEIRRQWYADDQIVTLRTPWPMRQAGGQAPSEAAVAFQATNPTANATTPPAIRILP